MDDYREEMSPHDITRRLKEEMKRLGIEVCDFYPDTHSDIPARLRAAVESGGSKPLLVADLADFMVKTHIDRDYVLTGRRLPLVDPGSDAGQMVQTYRALSRADQAAVARIVRSLSQRVATHREKAMDHITDVIATLRPDSHITAGQHHKIKEWLTEIDSVIYGDEDLLTLKQELEDVLRDGDLHTQQLLDLREALAEAARDVC